MNKEYDLSEKWIKASILGTIWAASEIVIGSFLHNLNVPFGGNILTAIAIIILISISFVWKEKGLFWRAGLICAIMKTMSPSAVIFGPMIAIFSEALLLEISVRLLGKTYVGYLTGAVLAMSWNLFQKIADLIILYGHNIINVYTKLIELLQKQLNLKFDIAWIPIIVIATVQVVLGILSATIGIKIGRKLLLQPASYKHENISNNFSEKQSNINSDFHYSLLWLVTNIILMIGSLVIISFSDWIIWSIITIVIISVWAIRYKKALQKLSKPKFWAFFILLTMITAFVFSKIQSNKNGLNYGLLIGLQMNFRAAIIIVGFSVIGIELYHPKIRAFFSTTSFKELPLALELSFESLPSIISTIPDFKSVIKNPIQLFYRIISQAEFRLKELKNKINFNQKIFIITGAVRQGKTTQIQKIIEILKCKNISVSGIYQPRIMRNNNTIGYDVVDIIKNEGEVFLRVTGNDHFDKIGRYYIYPEGLEKGKNALKISNNINNKIVIIDEVGKLELENKGWASCINDLIHYRENHIFLAVRDSNLEKISKKFNLKQKLVYNISETDYSTISNSILEQL